MRHFYNFILYLLLPFILLRLLWRSRKSPDYRKRWAERFGLFPAPQLRHPIWIHAVSFGEAKLAVTLIHALKKQFPQASFVVTTMTVTGSNEISKNFGNDVFHIYVPYDYPTAVQNFLNRIKPQILIIMETELWPNILQQCKKNNIPVVIANARLSPKSAQGYRFITFLTRPMLKNVAALLAQTQEDAARFIKLGLPIERAHIVGNIKFDVEIPYEKIAQGKQLREKLGQERPVWIAASTHQGEETIILQALTKMRETQPTILLILVPRHPERFDDVAALCQQNGFQLARRSNNNITPEIDIYLGDTMGELWSLYTASDIAFVGGSLVSVGGHNLLEPAALALPIITGPELFNFAQIAQMLQQANALNIIHNANELSNTALALLQNTKRREEQGRKAKEVVEQNHGALVKHCDLIIPYVKL